MDIKEVFAQQGEARLEFAQASASSRVADLKRLALAISASREALYKALHDDFEKAPTEVDLSEIHPVLSEINYISRNLEKWMRIKTVGSPMTLGLVKSQIFSEARGRVLILSPWNYPFQLAMSPLVGAIAAGNTVILKPSEKTPRTSELIAKILRECFSARQVHVVQGGAEVAENLLQLPFDHIFFTGSSRIGQIVAMAAAKNYATVTLELGGKSPAIVDESADLKTTAERIVWGKFLNAGQTCIAPDYVLVSRKISKDLIQSLRQALDQSFGSGPQSQIERLCKIIDGNAYARLTGLLAEAIEKGATIEYGGRSDAAARKIGPTVLSGIDSSCRIMSEEIFGPILPVIEFDELSEAIKYIKDRPKPLALYMFSRQDHVTDSVLKTISSGGAVVNNTLIHIGNENLPFGGVGFSGLGRYHGRYSFETFSHQKAVVKQGALNTAALFYQPYGRRMTELGRSILRFFDQVLKR